jgi:integrase
MTSTNYLNPEDFQKLVNAIPLVTEYNNGKLLNPKNVPSPDLLQAVLWVQYCHGLRVSEVLRLTTSNFNFKTNILTLEKTKTGFKKKDGVKVRKKQFTSIPPDFPKYIIDWITHTPLETELFKFTRQLIWAYVKKAARFANLELGEQQEERYIDGAWTHLLRKSRAKLMIEKGANMDMVKVKLRHSFTTTERYTKPDINALIKWESENL